MWVFDGDGRTLNGLSPPDTAFWGPDPTSSTGDRHSTSLISKRHPYLFTCFACDPDSVFKGGFIISPSPETQSRLMCIMHSDIGTVRYRCGPMGRSDGCMPGCSKVRCGQDPPYRTWMCSWHPEDLKRMMEVHDSFGMGYTEPMKQGMWPYNELLFDSWTQPWDTDLGKMVEGVFVQKRGTEKSKEHARLVHRKLLQRLGVAEDNIPLVEYDPSVEADPYRLLAYQCTEGDECEWLT